MNTARPQTTATASRRGGKVRASARGRGDYAAPAEVAALLADSLSVRQQRLSADDMASTDEAAALAQTTRVTVNAWITKGRAIGLTQTKRGFRLPRWQFEPAMWRALPQLAAALGTTEGWALLSFLESPHGALGGRTPRQAIEQGEADKVLRIAEHEGN